MAFRLMRYAIAAMQRHLDAGHDRLPLVIPVLFYHGLVTPIRSLCAGSMNSSLRSWPATFITGRFRWRT